MHKKKLFLLCSCLFIFSSALSMKMDELEKNIKDIKAGLSVNIDDVLQATAELSKNQQNYRKISLWSHPDRNPGNQILQEISKAANVGNQINKAKAVIAQATPEDLKRGRILDRKENLERETVMLQECSILGAVAINTLGQAQQEIVHNFADNIVGTTFTLLSDKLIARHLEDSEIKQEIKSCDDALDNLKNNQTAIANALKMHTDFQNELQESKTETDQKIQKKLKKLLNKKT